jgi:uncharacterized protein (DUF849 family)
MLLQAALNGPFTKGDHPAMPLSADELGLPELGRASWYLGAGAVAQTVRNHLHGFAATHGSPTTTSSTTTPKTSVTGA